ncbi:hypothetical protein [Arsenophonus endosymbiont of Aleurodicus floccissimus]|nr:hypothetical protein [Arsenophonus endosymbiont of Aleurodicus floccissimus]
METLARRLAVRLLLWGHPICRDDEKEAAKKAFAMQGLNMVRADLV